MKPWHATIASRSRPHHAGADAPPSQLATSGTGATCHHGFLPTRSARQLRWHAIGGGFDSRNIPNAQPVEEVADVIAQTIVAPAADLYTRGGMREMAARYYAADDMGAVEAELTMRTRPPAQR
jgi:hypothetical protein